MNFIKKIFSKDIQGEGKEETFSSMHAELILAAFPQVRTRKDIKSLFEYVDKVFSARWEDRYEIFENYKGMAFGHSGFIYKKPLIGGALLYFPVQLRASNA